MNPAEFRALGEAWGGTDWQRPLARALVAAGLLSGKHADVTVRRYVCGARGVPDAVIVWLEAAIASREDWLVGRTEKKRRGVVHLAPPRFVALLALDGSVGQVDWLDAKPDPRAIGKLLDEAVELAARR